MFDVNDCYFHSLILGEKEALEVFNSILKSGKILSLDKGGYDSNSLRMNNREEICLCKKGKLHLFYDSAYDLFVMRKLSFIIRDLPGIYKPEMIPIRETFGDTTKYIDSGKTDLYDEYRVKDEISLDRVIGINFPVNSILSSVTGYKLFFLGKNDSFRNVKFMTSKERVNNVISFYKKIVSKMDELGVNIPIYDIDTGRMIKSEDDIVKMKKRK